MSDIWKPKTVVSRDQHGEAIYHQTEAHEPQKHMVEATITLTNIPPSPSCEEKPHPKWYEPTERKKWVFEVLAFFIVCASAVVYFCQMEANRRQAKSAEDQLSEMQRENRLDERAWLGFSGDPPTNQIMDGRPIFPYKVKNTGKTPALREQHWGIYTPVPLSSNPSELRTNAAAGFGIIPPGGELSIFYEMPKDAEKTVMAENPCFYTTIVWYDDVFGNHHWSRITLSLNRPSTVHPYFWTDFANTGNDCDTNSPQSEK